MGMDTDSELLTRFAASGDRAAFAALVSRHATMVHGVALRRTQDRVLAEEVTQTVFAILARKARTLTGRNVTAWLHNATFFEARNARRKAARYSAALHQFSEHMTDMPTTANPSLEDLRLHLDEAMSRLPDKTRHILLLRFYEQRSVEEICAETGSNVEACRKRLQRSIHQLTAMLRRRGVISSATALTSALAAHGLCVAPASAAQIAAVALQAAPALTKSVLFANTLQLMNTATLIKSPVAILVLALIPITVLWNQKTALQEEVDRLHNTARVLPLAPVPGPPGTSSRPSAGPADTARTGIKDAKTPVSTAPSAPPAMEITLKRAQEKAMRTANMKYNRIVMNLPDLTEAQKKQLKETLEVNGRAATDRMMEAFQSGAVMRALQKPESLTAMDRAALAGVDPAKITTATDTEALKAILTAEQYAAFIKSQEARRVGDAENASFDTLKWMSRNIDLSAEQKDRIFQGLAQRELSPDLPPGEDGGKPLPGLDAHAAARDRIIRESLTPEQAAAFDQMRAEQMRAIEQEMMQFYAIPAEGKPEARK
jgi:RNA polymerase sigma factor (sigma-70 family)